MWTYNNGPNRLFVLNPFFNQSPSYTHTHTHTHTHTGVFAHAAQQEEYAVHIHKHREQARSYIETFPVVMFFLKVQDCSWIIDEFCSETGKFKLTLVSTWLQCVHVKSGMNTFEDDQTSLSYLQTDITTAFSTDSLQFESRTITEKVLYRCQWSNSNMAILCVLK